MRYETNAPTTPQAKCKDIIYKGKGKGMCNKTYEVSQSS